MKIQDIEITPRDAGHVMVYSFTIGNKTVLRSFEKNEKPEKIEEIISQAIDYQKKIQKL